MERGGVERQSGAVTATESPGNPRGRMQCVGGCACLCAESVSDGPASHPRCAQLHSSGGRSSVLLSIHQPNDRILALFDHILVLGQGGSVFFGTVEEAKAFFRAQGLPVPPNQTPTDYFLQVIDPGLRHATGLGERGVDFPGVFSHSPQHAALVQVLEDAARVRDDVEPPRETTSAWR